MTLNYLRLSLCSILLLMFRLSYGQVDIPYPSQTGPLGGGSWLRFTSGSINGSTTSIQESWGISLIGDFNHPVKVYNSSFLIGYNSVGENFGTNNLLVHGNVGIGTITPNTALEVNGGIAAGGNNLDGVNIGFLSNTGKTLIGWNRSQGDGETDFIGNQGSGSRGGFAYYNFNNTGTQSLLMYMRGNGQVQIGDCNPYSYKLAVAGSMIAESVTVKLMANWPDYVFKPSYKLRSLAEVKSYIDQNHHLPDMPSEKEVADKGLDLGEMNKLLTKKIEELTLYMIALQKQVDELKKK